MARPGAFTFQTFTRPALKNVTVLGPARPGPHTYIYIYIYMLKLLGPAGPGPAHDKFQIDI